MGRKESNQTKQNKTSYMYIYAWYKYLSHAIGVLGNALFINNVLQAGDDCLHLRERSGSLVEWQTRDRGAVDSSLTGVTALWSLSKTHLS